MPGFKYSDSHRLSPENLAIYAGRFLPKLAWFATREHPYEPHYYQQLFHTMHNPKNGNLCRFRHLVAGRRGGKTLSAAWEVLFNILHPEVFHMDAHGEETARPLHVWVLTKDHPAGIPALLTFREVLRAAGLEHGREYKENRSMHWFEFENGAFVQFKTADEPEGLRGAGLDILWMDEAAFIPNERAWQVVRPALSDKLGLVISTTTPSGKNWFYNEFWGEEAMADDNQGRVEYRSIDNPYFPAEEWTYIMRTYHPMLFKQEYMASFDSMQGKELLGDWLHYYEKDELPHRKDVPAAYSPRSLNLDLFIGVDPAISLSDNADQFSMALIGVTQDRHQIYLLEQFSGRIPFPEQVDLIASWHQKWRPRLIAIEKNAYQAALAQQVVRTAGFPPVAAIFTKGKKYERILSMSPLFRISKILIRKDHRDFINEWLDYDSELKNPHDDCLDAVELALRAAGVLLPDIAIAEDNSDRPAADINELMQRDLPSASHRRDIYGVDDHLGGEW
jgi:predicted phage terminase large subunit-like protein